MRLSEDQIRQGILHPDVDVRFACLHHFSEGDGRDTSVMPVAIEALERFGRTTAFRGRRESGAERSLPVWQREEVQEVLHR